MPISARAPTAEAPSNLHRGSRSMARGEIAVGISSTYRAYNPGRRRLAPITLLPKRDTTAYICDEYKVPSTISKDGRAHIEYLIGWTDLKAGMISVDAEHVRDYVSAQEYEEWNVKKTAEQDEGLRNEEEAENVKLVEDMEKAQREAEMKENGIVLRNGTLRIPGQGTIREQAAAHIPIKSRKKRSKPSRQRVPSLSKPDPLSTLTQIESGDTETEVQDNHCDEETDIRRQLEEEPMTGDTECLTYPSRESSPRSESGSSTPGRPEHPQKKRKIVSTSLQKPPRELDAGRAGSSAARRGDSLQNPVSRFSPGLSAQPQSSSATSTPLLKPAKEPSPTLESAKITLPEVVPIRSLPGTLSTASPSAAAAARPLISSAQSATPRTGFTPLGGQRSSPWASFSTSLIIKGRTPNMEAPVSTKSLPNPLLTPLPAEPLLPASTKPVPKSRGPSLGDDDPPEEVYEVKRLEGTKIFDTDGGPRRYFLVRWRGSWPQGQNPTWEPENNIPRDMARKFLMKQGAALGMDGVTNTPRRSAPSPWRQRRKWSSVSEAFTGEDDDPERGDSGSCRPTGDESVFRAGCDNGNELLLVTDEPSPAKKPALNWDMLMGRKFGEGT